jgi:hypothetical protein
MSSTPETISQVGVETTSSSVLSRLQQTDNSRYFSMQSFIGGYPQTVQQTGHMPTHHFGYDTLYQNASIACGLNYSPKYVACEIPPIQPISSSSSPAAYRTSSTDPSRSTIKPDYVSTRPSSVNSTLSNNPASYSSNNFVNLNQSYFLRPVCSSQEPRVQATTPRQMLPFYPDMNYIPVTASQCQNVSGSLVATHDYYGMMQSCQTCGALGACSQLNHPSVMTVNSYEHLNDHQLLGLLKIPKRNSEGKFLCPCCERGYKTNKHLKRHFYKHLHNRPYRCEWCSQKFDRTDILKRHTLRCKIKSADEQSMMKRETQQKLERNAQEEAEMKARQDQSQVKIEYHQDRATVLPSSKQSVSNSLTGPTEIRNSIFSTITTGHSTDSSTAIGQDEHQKCYVLGIYETASQFQERYHYV